MPLHTYSVGILLSIPFCNSHSLNQLILFQQISTGVTRTAVGLNYMLSRSAGKDANILIAPINIFKTLATVMLGTAGETEKELANILGGLVLGRKISEG